MSAARPSTPPAAVAPVLVVGTHSIHVRRFVRGLLDAGESVVLATDRAEPLVEHPALREQVVVDFAVRRFVATPRRLRQAIARWRPRIVHAHQANSVAWHAVRAADGRVPVVVTLWGSDVLLLPARSPLHRWMVCRTLRRASAWTADARVLLEAAAALADPQAGAPHTSSAPSTRPTPPTPGERAWIPLGIDAPPAAAGVARERRILSCRLHKPLYRIDAIVEAFARLPPACADWVLEVAADGPGRVALERRAAALGLGTRVEFSGLLAPDALARAYRRSAVFVSVPESDGTSVSLLEAMAAGCLPVLSDLPANREWVQDGQDGLLVADLHQLPAALERAIAWWQSGRWDAEGRPRNERRIGEHALFARNVEQFRALYARVASPAPNAAQASAKTSRRSGAA